MSRVTERLATAAATAAIRGRVLVVDDEPLWLRSTGRTLRARGYDVVECPTGHVALDSLARESFDAVLSDIAMPDLDGIQLLRTLRQRGFELPVILVTGEPAVNTAIQAVDHGAFHYFTKPVEPNRLDQILEKAVRAARLARSEEDVNALLALGAAPDPNAQRANLYRALDSLWMAYQPIVDVRRKEVFGHEALMRTGEPSLPHPGAVLEAAERAGELSRLGRRVRECAAAPFAAGARGALFVNLHTDDLLDETLFDPESPLSRIADRVVLEITERASLSRIPDLHARTVALRSMGYRLAIDDLGAGYAGLTSFALVEPEIVKLDMSLVRGVHESATKQKLIGSIARLCQDLGMLVVAEGVETLEERDALVSLGCDLLQGYFFAKPGRPFPEVRW